MAIKSTLPVIFIIAIFLSCGPKPPSQMIPPLSNPQEIWQLFAARYDTLKSLAVSGSFTFSNVQTYESKLQMMYSAPDSFAFLAEGTLGVDVARGALINGSGFWEAPREDYHENIISGQMIKFDEGDLTIDIDGLIKAVFFFIDLKEFMFARQQGTRYVYLAEDSVCRRELTLNRDSATPISQTVFYLASPDTAVVYVDYYGWESVSETMIIPGRITAKFDQNGSTADYSIKRAKENPEIPRSYFFPKF